MTKSIEVLQLLAQDKRAAAGRHWALGYSRQARELAKAAQALEVEAERLKLNDSAPKHATHTHSIYCREAADRR